MFAFITPIFTGIAFLYNLIPAPFRMIANWIMIGVAIVGVAFSYLKIKEHEARQQALIDFNKAQVELSQKENAEYKDKLDKLIITENYLNLQISTLNDQLDKKQKSVYVYIDKYKSSGLDPIFNDVIKKLK
jgi:hypothetical protein